MTDEFLPEHWEQRAQEARILAEGVHVPECRKIMIEIAVGYECMAEAARRFRQYGAAVIDETDAASLTSGVNKTLP